MTKIRVLVNGAAGKMGQEAIKAIQQTDDLMLVGQPNRGEDLTEAIRKNQAQVVVDLTTAAAVFENANKIIDAGAHPVIGTSGLLEDQVKQLAQRCAEKKLGALIISNFSIGAVLSMKYAKECARYFSSVEIIEMHHNRKADAPSSTAMRTAELIAEVKAKAPLLVAEKETLVGARGAHYKDIPIHAIRLPGILARQTILFGAPGETFEITHDISSREAYMPGLCLACRKVVTLDSLKNGLEHVL